MRLQKDVHAETARLRWSRALGLVEKEAHLGDGRVSREEFHAALPALGMDEASAGPLLDELFDEMDTDATEFLHYDEVRDALREWGKREEALLA